MIKQLPPFKLGLLITAIALITPAMALAQPSGYEGYRVVQIQIRSESDLEALRKLELLGRDFQIWSEVVALDFGPIEARVAPSASPALDASGLQYTIAIPDLQKYLDGLYSAEPLGDDRGGFFNSLQTYNNHVAFMDTLVATYPDLAQKVSLGTSILGRNMWALRITGPQARRKPAVFMHGAEHGNEQAPASIVAFVANHLLTNYGTNPTVTALVDNVEWYLLPIMNPDGYVAYDRYNAHGYDLNRNWGGPGSGQDSTGGPFPFSEAETAQLRSFLVNHDNVRVHVDLHGYVPWIMWPWGHTPTHCADHATFLSIGTVVRNRITAAGGGTYDIGSIYEVAYPVSGSSTNYSYNARGIWAFGIECLDDYMPSICQEFLSGMLYFGEWIDAHDCNANGVMDSDDITAGTASDCNGNGVPDQCECPGELDGNCTVNIADLAQLLSHYGDATGATYRDGDLTGDGAVNLPDLAALLAAYGTTCN